MQLLFKQRFFSWLDSYDIYNEAGETIYAVEGKLSWGHRLEIYDPAGRHLGTVKEEVLTFLPRFALYHPVQAPLPARLQRLAGTGRSLGVGIRSHRAGWTQGHAGLKGASKLDGPYSLSIARPEDALLCLMIVLAIDAAKCSSGDCT